MKMRKSRCVYILLAAVGLLSRISFADLGLAQIASEQGAQAVGQAVLAAAQAVYAENTDPDVIRAKLIEILDEAAATGNEQSVRYAVVAVMMAGGTENVGISVAAINASRARNDFPDMVAATVAEARALLTAGGGDAGGDAGGWEGGGGPAEIPLIIRHLYNQENLFGPGSPGDKPKDFPATPI